MAELPMLHVETDHIKQMLENGWSVVGYSTVIMAMGAMTHSILLQKGSELITADTTVSKSAAGWGPLTAATGFLSYSPKP
jgi:hypothetical protein